MRSLAVLLLVVGCYRGEQPAAPAAPAKAPAPARHARTASDPLGFLPIDTQLVAYVDMFSVQQSSLWARFEPQIMAKAGTTVAQFRVFCGFDPLRSIQSIAVAVRATDTPDTSAVVVVRGIQRAELVPCIEKALVQQPALGSIAGDIMTLRSSPGESPLFAQYVDARTLVIVTGQGSSVQLLRDVLDAGSPLRSSATFMELFGRVDPESGRRAGWLWVDGSSKVLDALVSAGVKTRGVFGSVDLTSGLAAKFFVRMPTPTDAQHLVTTFQGQLPALQALVAKLELAADDADVVIELGLTDDQLAMLAMLLP